MATTPLPSYKESLGQPLHDRIATLEAENAGLRSALQDTGSRSSGGQDQSSLLADYEKLVQAHEQLKKKFQEHKKFVKRATEKYRAAKESARQWKEFYDHQQKKAAKLHDDIAARPSSPGFVPEDAERTPRPQLAHRPASPTLPGAGQDVNAADQPFHILDPIYERAGLFHTKDVESRVDSVRQSSEAPEAGVERATSSQSTEDELDLADAFAIRPSDNEDDEPEFVSARPVKRRRGNSPRTAKAATQIKQEQTSPEQPHEINSEDYSSPVIERRRPFRRETSNLDAIIDSTPYCRGRRAVSAEISGPPRMPTMNSSLSEGDLMDVQHVDVKKESDASQATPEEPVRENRSGLQPKASDRALQSLSTNIAQSPRLIDAGNTNRKRREHGRSGGAYKAAIVSEDGDMDSSQVHAPEPQTAFKAAVSHRLDSLLDDPTPSRREVRRILPAPKNTRRPPEDRPDPDMLEPKTSEQSPAKKERVPEQRPVFRTPNMPARRPQAASTGALKRPLQIRSPPPPGPEDEPLRARPFNRLSLEDFKINPKFAGTDFAFADTLRGRDQRRCLPGCTRPECCGDGFRKLAEMGVRGSKTDDQVLEAYLGPNYESHLASRPAAERKEILIKARTYAMASEHGKHRQAFKRHTTPPGFWRIDMPTTQEEAQDRDKAVELGRQEVYERWREAMNPNGRWKFRDE